MRAAILIIASFTCLNATQAQTWGLQESAATLKGAHHELLPRPGGEVLTITHPDAGHKGPTIISRFDARLNELYSRRLNLLNHEQYQAAWYAGDRLFLFTTDARGGLTRYELDDQSGALIGSPLPLTGLLGLDGKTQKASFYSGHSTNGRYHYIAAANGNGTMLHGILFNATGDKLSVFQSPITTRPGDCIQTGDGDLCIFFDKPATAQSATTDHLLLHITTTGVCQSTPLTGLGDVSQLCWWADSSELHFAALASPSKPTAEFTAITTGTVGPATGIASGCHQTAVTTLLKPDVQTQGLPQNCRLLRQLPLSDGSTLILFENSGRRLYQNQWSAAGFTPISAQTQGASYLSRGDIYVLKIDAAGAPQWMDIVAKNQEESERLTAIGAGCLVDAADNLHVFFYDSPSNADVWKANPTPVRADDPHNNEFACITIAPTGTGKKQFLTPADNRYRLMPELAFTGDNHQACFLAIRARQGFSNELAFDFAGYKLGVIRIQ
jgi:hypothetical protein